MHPMEHIIYFSGIFIYLLIPVHPYFKLYHIFYAGIKPNTDNSGLINFFKKWKMAIMWRLYALPSS